VFLISLHRCLSSSSLRLTNRLAAGVVQIQGQHDSGNGSRRPNRGATEMARRCDAFISMELLRAPIALFHFSDGYCRFREPFLDKATTIVFVCSLCEWDQKMREDEARNRFSDSLQLFETLVTNMRQEQNVRERTKNKERRSLREDAHRSVSAERAACLLARSHSTRCRTTSRNRPTRPPVARARCNS
jgi:hypothetical protein